MGIHFHSSGSSPTRHSASRCDSVSGSSRTCAPSNVTGFRFTLRRYNQVMKFVTSWFAVAMLHAADANLLQTGRFQYRTTIDGKDAGASEITIRRSEGSSFIFTNHVTCAFVQQWEAVAA